MSTYVAEQKLVGEDITLAVEVCSDPRWAASLPDACNEESSCPESENLVG